MTEQHLIKRFVSDLAYGDLNEIVQWYNSLQPEQITRELWVNMLAKRADILAVMDHPMVDSALLFEAYKAHPGMLHDLPHKRMTQAIALDYITLQIDIYMPTPVTDDSYKIPLSYLPEHLKTPAFIEALYAQSHLAKVNPEKFAFVLLPNLPESARTERLCQDAFNWNFKSMHYMPEQFLTYEMCKQAITYDAYLLELVPNTLVDLALCKLALVKGNRSAGIYCPPENLDEALIYAMVQDHPHLIRKVPEGMCDAALIHYVLDETILQSKPDYVAEEVFRNIPHALKDDPSIQQHITQSKSPLFIFPLAAHLIGNAPDSLIENPDILKRWNALLAHPEAKQEMKINIHCFANKLHEALNTVDTIDDPKVMDEIVEFIEHAQRMKGNVKNIVTKVNQFFQDPERPPTKHSYAKGLSL